MPLAKIDIALMAENVSHAVVLWPPEKGNFCAVLFSKRVVTNYTSVCAYNIILGGITMEVNVTEIEITSHFELSPFLITHFQTEPYMRHR